MRFWATMKSPDRIDHAILAALQKNARLTNKELAAAVGLAPSSCLERVRRLEAAGVLRGYHAEVDLKQIGIGMQAMIMVRLNKHSRQVVETFRSAMAALPEVLDVYLVAGVHDFLIHVAAPDPEYLRAFALDHVTNREEVVHVETSLIFEHRRNHVLRGFT